MPEPRIAAFFDFDNTILNGDGAEIGIKYLWDRGEVSLGYILKVLAANVLFKRDWIRIETMGEVCMGLYKGHPLEKFASESEEYYRGIIQPKLAPTMLQKVEEHREEGHILVLQTGSVRYLMEPVIEDLKFDHLLCSDLEVGPNGLLTGKATQLCLADNKRKMAEDLARQESIDLSQSFAYADHHSDLPMLELVGHPVAVEPSDKLKQWALSKSVPILKYGELDPRNPTNRD